MRIAYLSVFYPYRGGIAQFNAALFRALEKNHEVKAFNFSRLYPGFLFPGKSQYVDANDKADNIPTLRILDSVNPLTYPRTAREILEYHPDLFLIQYWMPFVAPSLGSVAASVRRRGIKTVSIVANVKPHEKLPFETMLNKAFINRNDGIIVLAEAVKNDLMELKPDARCFVHPHPNYEHFGRSVEKSVAREKLGIPQDKKLLFFFGFIRHYKGLDILLETLAGLPDDYHLLVAGEVYGNFGEYEQIISRHKLQDRLHLHLEYINDDDAALYFSAADVCVLPYRTATQSGIVGVSYHFGVPVISTDVGGLKEVIEPYDSGMVVGHSDPLLIRDAVMKYFNDGLQDYYKKNISRFKERFTWDSLAEGIVNFSREL